MRMAVSTPRSAWISRSSSSSSVSASSFRFVKMPAMSCDQARGGFGQARLEALEPSLLGRLSGLARAVDRRHCCRQARWPALPRGLLRAWSSSGQARRRLGAAPERAKKTTRFSLACRSRHTLGQAASRATGRPSDPSDADGTSIARTGAAIDSFISANPGVRPMPLRSISSSTSRPI